MSLGSLDSGEKTGSGSTESLEGTAPKRTGTVTVGAGASNFFNMVKLATKKDDEERNRYQNTFHRGPSSSIPQSEKDGDAWSNLLSGWGRGRGEAAKGNWMSLWLSGFSTNCGSLNISKK